MTDVSCASQLWLTLYTAKTRTLELSLGRTGGYEPISSVLEPMVRPMPMLGSFYSLKTSSFVGLSLRRNATRYPSLDS